MGPVSETLSGSSTAELKSRHHHIAWNGKLARRPLSRGPCRKELACLHIHNTSNNWTQRHDCKSNERRDWARLALRYGSYLCSITLGSRFRLRCFSSLLPAQSLSSPDTSRSIWNTHEGRTRQSFLAPSHHNHHATSFFVRTIARFL